MMIRRLLALALLLPSLTWADYDSVVALDSPVHWYKLKETSGTAAVDSGSITSNGTYTGGYTLNQASILPSDPVGPSVAFNGSTGYVDFGGSSPAIYGPSDFTGAGWTLEMWVDSWGGNVLYSRSDTGNLAQQILISNAAVTPGDFNAQLEHCSGGHYGVVQATGTSAAAVYHVVVTTLGNGSQTLQHARIYVNKVKTELSSFSGLLCSTSNAPAQFSGWKVGGVHQYLYGGKAAHIAFYNYELTQAQVDAHFNAGMGIGLPNMGRRIFQSRRTIINPLWLPVSFGVREPQPFPLDDPTFVIDKLNKRAIRSQGVYAQ